MDEGSPRAAAKPPWMMHLLRGVICQTRGDLNLATLHMEKAAELGDLGDDSSHEGRSLGAQRALISEVAGRLQRVKSELDGILSTLPKSPKPQWISCFYRATMFQDWSTVILLNWCLKQVEGCGYLAMLDSSVEKPWTKVPSLRSFKDFERIALFCYLWKEFKEAQRTQSQAAPSSEETIVVVVESLEQILQIPAPLIFSTISSMGADVEMAGLPTVQPDFTLGQINRQAVENLMRLTEIDLWPSNWNNLDDRYADLFISTYASLHSDVEVTDEERQFRISVQKFVRQFADPQLSQNEHSVDPQKAYLWKITSVRGIEEVLNEENVKDNAPALQQSGSATPTAEPQPDTLPADGECDPRPASCVSVDMLATPRSSLSSSKASLRSFKRLGRVANSLLKRGGSGANQRPSEAMNRDSHSSWSLRRLTGVSYLSGISGTPEDYEPEGDTVMEDAGLMD
jgi:hypothetical protein